MDQIEVLPPESTTAALEAIERAQIDVQIATAKKYERKLPIVRQKMMALACADEATASRCFYTLPRGGKSISGPSVRLAEIALSSYGNIRSATRCVATVTSGEAPHCVVQSVVHDLENNVAVCMEKRRRIVGKSNWQDGKKVGNKAPDEDDINLAVNACAAIAFRDAVFKVIPQALISPVLAEARKLAIGDVKSIVSRRSKVLERLLKMGVSMNRILDTIGARSESDIDAAKLEILIGLGTALKDGDTTVEEAFPETVKPEPTPQPAATVQIYSAAPAPVASPEPETETVAATDEPADDPGDGPKLSEAQRQLSALLDSDEFRKTGGTFDDVRDFATNSLKADVSAVTSIMELPDELCRQLVAKKTGLRVWMRGNAERRAKGGQACQS